MSSVEVLRLPAVEVAMMLLYCNKFSPSRRYESFRNTSKNGWGISKILAMFTTILVSPSFEATFEAYGGHLRDNSIK